MVDYKGKILRQVAAKTAGKNQSMVDGFYQSETGEAFFIKKPADKNELFTELFSGLLLREFMARDLIDPRYFPSLICADLVQFDDGSYGLIQPKVSFTELFKIIQTGYSDGSDRDPLTEMLAGPSYYTELTQQGQYFGLSLSLMFSLLLGDYSVHSGNVVVLNGKPDEPKQFARIDWGAAFRYFAHEENNKDILVPYEYQGLLNFKWLTKGYINNYTNIAGLFPAIAEKATDLISQLDKTTLKEIVSSALGKIPKDLLNEETKNTLANYMSIPIFSQTEFGHLGNYLELADVLSTVLSHRLAKISSLNEKINLVDTSNLYRSAILSTEVFIDVSKPIPDQFEFLLKNLSEHKTLNFKGLDLSRLATEFNHYVHVISKQTDIYNLWEHRVLANLNLFTTSKNQTLQQLIGNLPLMRKYRESVLLADSFHLSWGEDLIIADYAKPYKLIIEAYKEDCKLKNPAWFKSLKLLDTSFEVLKVLKRLKENSSKVRVDLIELKKYLESFRKARLAVNKELMQRSFRAKSSERDSLIFYHFTEDELHALSDAELYYICIDESRTTKPSALMATLIKNEALWQRIQLKTSLNSPEREPQWRLCFVDFEKAKQRFDKAPMLNEKQTALEKLKETFNKLPRFLQNDPELKLVLSEAEQTLALGQSEFSTIIKSNLEFNEAKNQNEQLALNQLETPVKNLPKIKQEDKINLLNLKQHKLASEDSPTQALEKTGLNQRINVKLQAAVKADEILRIALAKLKPDFTLTEPLVLDLLALQKYKKEQISEDWDRRYGEEHNNSIRRFYKRAVELRLSPELSAKAQSNAILKAAHEEFEHRDEATRLIADIVMVLSAFVGVGLLIMAGRYCLNDAVFFSTAKTKREADLNSQCSFLMHSEDLENCEQSACLSF
ncbi:MAG: LepB GTPase-activating domain-containing protein [Tatlockia sp.]|nr:LepB GTPase-activating domain-containing protein [Tatlockia sp.]